MQILVLTACRVFQGIYLGLLVLIGLLGGNWLGDLIPKVFPSTVDGLGVRTLWNWLMYGFGNCCRNKKKVNTETYCCKRRQKPSLEARDNRQWRLLYWPRFLESLNWGSRFEKDMQGRDITETFWYLMKNEVRRKQMREILIELGLLFCSFPPPSLPRFFFI